jgi:hypothetical protein
MKCLVLDTREITDAPSVTNIIFKTVHSSRLMSVEHTRLLIGSQSAKPNLVEP